MCTFGAECIVKNVTSERLNLKRKSGIDKNPPKTLSANSMYDFLNKYAVCKCPPVIDCLEKLENDNNKKSGVICGSDGIEYENKCQLERRQCLLQRRIWVSSKKFIFLT